MIALLASSPAFVPVLASTADHSHTRGHGARSPAAHARAAPCDTIAGAGRATVLLVRAALGTIRITGDPTRPLPCATTRGAGARWRVRGDTLELSIPGGTGVAAPEVDVRVRTALPLRLVLDGATVEATGTDAAVTLRATTGRVRLVQVATIRGEVGTARLAASRVAGGVQLRSTTGPLLLDDVAGDVLVDGGSGDVVLRGARGATLDVRTTSGAVRWQGVPDALGRYVIRTTTGPVDLAIAPGAPTAGRCAVRRGECEIGDGLVVLAREVIAGRHVRTWRTAPAPAGPPAERVVIESVTGAVRIVRAARLPPPGRLGSATSHAR
ncbi:MAG: hypothetical protein MUF21_04200 [Gemmatimonadaceae bacterium]|nr:hypothetical protein [Gemmatimonadaceae bacterium]